MPIIAAIAFMSSKSGLPCCRIAAPLDLVAPGLLPVLVADAVVADSFPDDRIIDEEVEVDTPYERPANGMASEPVKNLGTDEIVESDSL